MTDTPYTCGRCGASGVKLWRPAGGPYRPADNRCGPCALLAVGTDRLLSRDGTLPGRRHGRTDRIHSPGSTNYVPCMPSESDVWGYTYAPPDVVEWWRALPLVERVRNPVVTPPPLGGRDDA